MNLDQHDSTLSDYVYYHTKQNMVYFTRCHDFLQQMHDRPPEFAEEMLCDGPISYAYAPFYIAWHMGLLPIKDGHACNETPVFYDIPGSGFDKIPEDTQAFVEIMVDLISNPRIKREAVSMMIEFHDFLAVRNRHQALRFMVDIIEDWASRFGDVTTLLSLRGEDERLQHSEDFAGTLKEALVVTGLLDKGISLLPSAAMAQAYRRLKWPEMKVHANEVGIESVLGVDLGL
ncbi:hypothetical protein RBE51_21580 [Pseudomonas taiwanensis]|uniref:hypothetical protein n=1 Tax=Pseudomonas taiwanensis TaxID=470150 RepID=UPI0028E03942|nr:hypothetical protein [Pseudomonas taiwanensis]MDT8925391.1 hypothetical protein [Pseudomonas taiwanensis]